jgi:hypothetical protein
MRAAEGMLPSVRSVTAQGSGTDMIQRPGIPGLRLALLGLAGQFSASRTPTINKGKTKTTTVASPVSISTNLCTAHKDGIEWLWEEEEEEIVVDAGHSSG